MNGFVVAKTVVMHDTFPIDRAVVVTIDDNAAVADGEFAET